MHAGKKESPVNRLSVILFGAVPILLALALVGCGTGVSPPAAGGPRCRAQMGRRRQWCRQEAAAGLRAAQGGGVPTLSPTRMVTLIQAPTRAHGKHHLVPWPCSQVGWAVFGEGSRSKPPWMLSRMGVTSFQCCHKPGHPQG